MDYPHDQIDELKRCWPNCAFLEEAGKPYFLFPLLPLPEGCSPRVVDALLCPHNRGDYPCRLFFAEKITTPRRAPNWNTDASIGGRRWHAFSWQLGPGDRRLAQMVRGFLKGLE